MSINLEKGKTIILEKGLSEIVIGSGWAKRMNLFRVFNEFDVDLSAFLLQDNHILEEISYRHLKTQGVIHSGDNLTGSSGKKVDEEIIIKFDKLKSNINKIVITANIFRAKKRLQHFGQIKKGFCTIYDAINKKELCYADFKAKEFNNKITIYIADLIKRDNNIWTIKGRKEGTTDDNLDIIRKQIESK